MAAPLLPGQRRAAVAIPSRGGTMFLEKFRLDGKTALITGGGRGIGLACSRALAEAGAAVVIADSDPATGEAGRAELAGLGLAVETVAMDVTRSGEVDAVAARMATERGGIDILVNNAGIARSDTRAEDTSDEHWLNVIDVNLNGVFWCCRAFGRGMLAKGAGAIVNIGSMSGYIVNKPQPQCFYNASKAGVHHLTKSLAAEWAARGVRVNAVAPTYIETPLTRFGMEDQRLYPVWLENTPMGRVGQPEEIASVVLFLASDAASLMTGSIVVADGGYTCW
jgi:NAD(P)-dependent dehydrogenase (short-subunit alcohol dehydrogenase family)